jgi:Mg2+/Co2+ transporter CorB
MTLRSHIEAIDLDAPIDETRRQVAAITRLPVFRGQLDEIAVCRVRSVLNLGAR